ncbi:Anthranilate phosphoribosyltransferase [Gossypium arboreum]|uniref:Anthranilate phosphoribosyltransferase n=1 Tax=Gossypium arboreum TaxID=29729 RepID=A0A0B0Q0M9_GOSAR|nr:Anthranilate phosphoribosyltransferase [Gossypium arboreum]
MFSKMVKLVDLLIKLKELKKENQARERRRSSSSRLGLFLPNTRFLGLVSFWVFVTVNEVITPASNFWYCLLSQLRRTFGMYGLFCFVKLWVVNFEPCENGLCGRLSGMLEPIATSLRNLNFDKVAIICVTYDG